LFALAPYTKGTYIEDDMQYNKLLGFIKEHLKVETDEEIKNAIRAMTPFFYNVRLLLDFAV